MDDEDPLICPRCKNSKITILRYTDEKGNFQHSSYACTHWQSKGPRCGWTGWTVPENED